MDGIITALDPCQITDGRGLDDDLLEARPRFIGADAGQARVHPGPGVSIARVDLGRILTAMAPLSSALRWLRITPGRIVGVLLIVAGLL